MMNLLVIIFLSTNVILSIFKENKVKLISSILYEQMRSQLVDNFY